MEDHPDPRAPDSANPHGGHYGRHRRGVQYSRIRGAQRTKHVCDLQINVTRYVSRKARDRSSLVQCPRKSKVKERKIVITDSIS